MRDYDPRRTFINGDINEFWMELIALASTDRGREQAVQYILEVFSIEEIRMIDDKLQMRKKIERLEKEVAILKGEVPSQEELMGMARATKGAA